MKKIVVFIIVSLMLVSSNQLILAEGYYNIDVESCNELSVSYYNGGEFYSPMMAGYYKYVTHETDEIEDILSCLKNIDMMLMEGGFGASGGESLSISVDGEEIVSFLLSSSEHCFCYTFDKSYYFSHEEIRKLEDVILKYKTKNDVKIYLDGEEIKFPNSPVIVNDRTLVPAKALSEILEIESGGSVDKDGVYRVVLTKEDKSLVIYNDRVYEDKTYSSVDVGCQVIGKLAMVPIRKVAEFFGYDVTWENDSVYIVSDKTV